MFNLKLIFEKKNISASIVHYLFNLLYKTGCFKPTSLQKDLKKAGFSEQARDALIETMMKNLPASDAMQHFDWLESDKILQQLDQQRILEENSYSKSLRWLGIVLEKTLAVEKKFPAEMIEKLTDSCLSDFVITPQNKYQAIIIYGSNQEEAKDLLSYYHQYLNHLTQSQYHFLFLEKQNSSENNLNPPEFLLLLNKLSFQLIDTTSIKDAFQVFFKDQNEFLVEQHQQMKALSTHAYLHSIYQLFFNNQEVLILLHPNQFFSQRKTLLEIRSDKLQVGTIDSKANNKDIHHFLLACFNHDIKQFKHEEKLNIQSKIQVIHSVSRSESEKPSQRKLPNVPKKELPKQTNNHSIFFNASVAIGVAVGVSLIGNLFRKS